MFETVFLYDMRQKLAIRTTMNDKYIVYILEPRDSLGVRGRHTETSQVSIVYIVLYLLNKFTLLYDGGFKEKSERISRPSEPFPAAGLKHWGENNAILIATKRFDDKNTPDSVDAWN